MYVRERIARDERYVYTYTAKVCDYFMRLISKKENTTKSALYYIALVSFSRNQKRT